MEINKCLEDPNTQYSDQYMPLAMMPAVVEAIQNAGGGGSGGNEIILLFGERTAHSYVTPPTDAPVLPEGYVWDEDNQSSMYYPIKSDGTPYTADEVEDINLDDIILTNMDENDAAQTFTNRLKIVGKQSVQDSNNYISSCLYTFLLPTLDGSSITQQFGFIFYGEPSEP